ncbi:MAG: hypothetical protein WA434_08870 [Candidatus Acidiferrales bacterium]
MLPTRIILASEELLTVHLRDAQSARAVHSEIILDVNHAGRWIRGIELLGGVDFNLERAVEPFNPRRPLSGESGGVTYDKDADAAFIYFSMKTPDERLPETALKYSHSITPEAECCVRFRRRIGLAAVFSPRREPKLCHFVSLINAPVERVPVS